MNGYPKGFLIFVTAFLIALWLSGILLLPSVAVFRLEWDYDWLMDLPFSSGDLRHTITTLHAIFAWSFTAMVGAIWTIHMRGHWRRRENRFSGGLFSFLWIALFISALGIYYFGDPDNSLYSSLIHSAVGLMIPLMLWQHKRSGKKAVEQNRSPSRKV
ncbi:hypothetical protein [Thiomicrorhabdus sp.]|uniref:hypothetical protein n=1 Tax=Thiomicrorhabdus sp. TaxID=2039724 RepID=UPI0029C878D3|nr:hypothetical protein [Thiomicrorhabdus sp.]